MHVHHQNVFHCKVKLCFYYRFLYIFQTNKAAILEMRGSEAESKYFGHVVGTRVKGKNTANGNCHLPFVKFCRRYGPEY